MLDRKLYHTNITSILSYISAFYTTSTVITPFLFYRRRKTRSVIAICNRVGSNATSWHRSTTNFNFRTCRRPERRSLSEFSNGQHMRKHFAYSSFGHLRIVSKKWPVCLRDGECIHPRMSLLKTAAVF